MNWLAFVPVEMRILAVELADLILDWYHQTQ